MKTLIGLVALVLHEAAHASYAVTCVASPYGFDNQGVVHELNELSQNSELKRGESSDFTFDLGAMAEGYKALVTATVTPETELRVVARVQKEQDGKVLLLSAPLSDIGKFVKTEIDPYLNTSTYLSFPSTRLYEEFLSENTNSQMGSADARKKLLAFAARKANYIGRLYEVGINCFGRDSQKAP